MGSCDFLLIVRGRERWESPLLFIVVVDPRNKNKT